MRFRRKIKIAKGLSLNLSKSGLSLSSGVRGASLTLGGKGTYVNYGLPGTGIYNREKIGGSSRSTKSSVSKMETGYNVSVELDEKGNAVITVKDSSGFLVTDESIIRKIKKSDSFKQNLVELMEEKKSEIDEETAKFINIHKFTPRIVEERFFIDELNNLSPQVYVAEKYNVPVPTKESVTQELFAEAKQKIRMLFSWKNKKLREAYVSENFENRFQQRTEEWKKANQLFDEAESINKSMQDKEFYDEFAIAKKELENILHGDADYVNEKIEAILNDIVLPVQFSVNYEYSQENKQLKIDLDLPEIEDMPKEKANMLSSGKISIKQKTQKEVKQEYATCVSGIAFYLCGAFFNISTSIKEILISAYTQRLNKATGIVEDQYIYSLKLTRDKFASLNFENIDPIEAFQNFENNRVLSGSYDFKTIVPW